MHVTRADFLRYTSLTVGLGAAALAHLAGGGEASAASGTPDGAPRPPAPDGPLDSQRFRQAVVEGHLAIVEQYLERDPALAFSRDEKGRSVFALAHLAGHAAVAEALRPRLDSLDLVEAVLAGDARRAGELLEKLPALVNEPHPVGRTAVHVAVARGRLDLLLSFLRAGPDFNRPSAAPEALTPLRLAVEHPEPATAEALVDSMAGNGGDANARQGDGLSPLHAAAAAGRTGIARVLIFSGADPEARTPRGETPLDLALRHGRKETAELLRGAARLPRNHRTSRFLYTAGGGRFERKEQPPIPWPIVNEYVGVSHGNLARMRELLAVHPNLLHVNASWNELGVEAGAHVGFKDGVRFLLDQGAPCSLPTAAMMGMTAHVRRLLAEDPKRIWECGAHNMPPIWFPAIGGGTADHLEIARLLLDAGADVNAHKRGQTALHWAARGGQVEMAELLLERGADVGAKAITPEGEATPLDLAVKAGKEDAARLLRR